MTLAIEGPCVMKGQGKRSKASEKGKRLEIYAGEKRGFPGPQPGIPPEEWSPAEELISS